MTVLQNSNEVRGIEKGLQIAYKGEGVDVKEARNLFFYILARLIVFQIIIDLPLQFDLFGFIGYMF